MLERLARTYLLSALALAGLAAAFGQVAAKALAHHAGGRNEGWLRALHAHATPALDTLALACAAIGSELGILAVAGLAYAVLLRRGRRADAIALVAAVAGGVVWTVALKAAFQNPRPALFPQLVSEPSYSFPSGHTTLSACLYGFLAIWLVLTGPRSAGRWLAASGLMALAALVGVSRVYLGVHWPTDVLAGWLVAAGWLVVVFTLRARFGPAAGG